MEKATDLASIAGIFKGAELAVLATVVVGTAAYLECETVGGTKFLDIGCEARRLGKGRQLIFACHRIFHWRQLEVQHSGNLESARDAVQVDFEWLIAESQEIGSQVVKHAKGGHFGKNGFDRCPLRRWQPLINHVQSGSIPQVYGLREQAELSEGCTVQDYAVVEPSLNMPEVDAFAITIGRGYFKVTGATLVAVTARQ